MNIVISIFTDNDAFQTDMDWELASVFNRLGRQMIVDGSPSPGDRILIFDTNGNQVGVLIATATD
jgi:hypothetical protein